MTQIISYLTFNGSCREAMSFYQSCLGGELSFQTVGESSISGQMPPEMQDIILHAVLSDGVWSIMGSDMVGEQGLVRGSNISIMLNCSNEDEIRGLYEKLSKGGMKTHPIENTFWGALFGDLTDRFGNQWLLHFDKQFK